MRPRRAVAALVLAALAVGIGLFVAVWALGDGGTDDEAEEDPTTTGATTTPAIDSVAALAEALGCDDVGGFGVPTVPGVDSGACARSGDSRAAGLHVADDEDAAAGLLTYLEEHSGDWTGFATCAGETPEQVTARAAFAVVAGPRWVVTTRFAAVRDAAVAAGGHEVAFSPVGGIPPVSYLIGGPPCGVAPEILPG